MTLLNKAQLLEKYPAFSPQQLRWLLVRREVNGLATATLKVGKQVLIDEQAWQQWLDSHREVAHAEKK